MDDAGQRCFPGSPACDGGGRVMGDTCRGHHGIPGKAPARPYSGLSAGTRREMALAAKCPFGCGQWRPATVFRVRSRSHIMDADWLPKPVGMWEGLAIHSYRVAEARCPPGNFGNSEVVPGMATVSRFTPGAAVLRPARYRFCRPSGGDFDRCVRRCTSPFRCVQLQTVSS